jgi:hypothetical protein
MLRDMGEYRMIAHDARFASQSVPDGTPWQALSPRYLKRKRKTRAASCSLTAATGASPCTMAGSQP